MFSVLRKAFWILGIVIFLLIIFLPPYTKLQELKEKNRELETKIRQLEIDNSLLEYEFERIEKDPFYQERIAREKMGLVRKGEIPLKIVPEKKD